MGVLGFCCLREDTNNFQKQNKSLAKQISQECDMPEFLVKSFFMQEVPEQIREIPDQYYLASLVLHPLDKGQVLFIQRIGESQNFSLIQIEIDEETPQKQLERQLKGIVFRSKFPIGCFGGGNLPLQICCQQEWIEQVINIEFKVIKVASDIKGSDLVIILSQNKKFTFAFSISIDGVLYLVLKTGKTPKYKIFQYQEYEIDSPGFDFVLAERLSVNIVQRNMEYEGLISTNSGLILLFS